MSYFKPLVNFSLNFASPFIVMRDKPCVLFLAETLYDFYKRSQPLLTAQVKFHQICTLIGYFCWKYIKFQLKIVWRKYVSWYQRVVQNLMKNLNFVSKMTRIWWVLIRALKNLKNLHFDWSLLSKVENAWATNLQRICK